MVRCCRNQEFATNQVYRNQLTNQIHLFSCLSLKRKKTSLHCFVREAREMGITPPPEFVTCGLASLKKPIAGRTDLRYGSANDFFSGHCFVAEVLLTTPTFIYQKPFPGTVGQRAAKAPLNQYSPKKILFSCSCQSPIGN